MSATVAVIPSFNGLAHLRQSLPAILAQSLPFTRVIVVDDGSADGSVEELRARGDVEVLSLAANRGFCAAANAGIARALGDPATIAVALLNNDVELDREWHRAAAAVLFSDPLLGSCATCLLRADSSGRVDSAGIEWRAPGWADNFLSGDVAPIGAEPRPVFGASAGAALYRRELFEDVGLFDESLVMYQEDVDLALRARRAGWATALAPAARGWHLGCGSNRPFPLGGSWADYWNARNRLPVVAASLEGDEWRRSWRSILAAQARHALASIKERRAPAVIAGSARALTRLPGAIRRRRRAVEASVSGPARRLPASSGWARVSVVVIARDAARLLPSALATIPAGAEVVVADGASRDGTVETARARGARVIVQDLAAVAAAGGNFDVARNDAARQAGREWVLFLDADERISPRLAAEISRSVDAAEVVAYDMPRVNLFWGKPVRLLGEDRQLRLVRHGRGRFEGRELHRPMRADGPIGHLSAPLVHDNVRSWADVVRRFRRDVPIQAAVVSPPAGMVDACRIALRMFRYYYFGNGAWRDGARGFAAALAYAFYEGAIAAAALRRRCA